MSRLAVLHQDRFLGFAWVGLGFREPSVVPFDLDAAMTMTKQLLGYEAYSYWEFFLRPDAGEVIQKNVSNHAMLQDLR